VQYNSVLKPGQSIECHAFIVLLWLAVMIEYQLFVDPVGYQEVGSRN
jgi:hypothetical protein